MSNKPQIPRAEDGLVCPYHQKDTADVCHRCPKWVQLRGQDPQTGGEIDRWSCSDALLPLLLIENAQQVRQHAAATESFRNEMVKATQLGQAMFQAAVTTPPVPAASMVIKDAAPRAGLLGRVFRLDGRG